MIPLIVALGLDLAVVAGEDLHWWDVWKERQSRSSSSQIWFILIKVKMFILIKVEMFILITVEMFIEGSLTSILGTEQIWLVLIEM